MYMYTCIHYLYKSVWGAVASLGGGQTAPGDNLQASDTRMKKKSCG